MKRILFILSLVFWASISYAQNIYYTIESTFQPLTMEKMMMTARANAYRHDGVLGT